jgi:hypothetical protein
MCKCADVQMCKFFKLIALRNLHICTFAHLHIILYLYQQAISPERCRPLILMF